VFIYFDLKQAEAQIVAYRADIPKWKEQFEQTRIDDSYDAHRALARKCIRCHMNWYLNLIGMTMTPNTQSDMSASDADMVSTIECRYQDLLSKLTLYLTRELPKAFHFYHRSNPEIEVGGESKSDEYGRNEKSGTV
jgi:hypothetical protein